VGDAQLFVEMCAGVRSGCLKAEQQFANTFRETAIKSALKWAKRSEDAEDFAHDALVIVLRRLREKGLSQPEQLDRYILRTVKFVVFTHQRKHAFSRTGPIADIEALYISDQNTPYKLAESANIDNTLDFLLSRLKQARDRELLHRHYRDDWSKPDLCEYLGITAEHFDRVVWRARKRLKKIVCEQAPELSL